MSRILAFIAIIVVFINNCNAEGYYTIVGSKVFHANSQYHISVSSHGIKEKCTMKVGIEGTSESGGKLSLFKDVTLDPDSSQMIEIDVGPVTSGDYKLKAEGLTGIIFKNESTVNFNQKSFSVFIQTDKAIYKPGDTIRFRALFLDANLKPAPIKGKVKVHINDSKQNRIKQWLDVQPAKGVFSSELPLSDSTVLGDWVINVEAMGSTFRKTIEVAEYVLPKFEVTIDAAKHASFKDGKIRATIRSKYTYGKPVKGEATVSVFPKFYGSYQPFISELITRKVVPIDGKAPVEFDIQNELNFKEDYQRDIMIEAIVEEALTGRKQNTSTSITLHRTKYTVDIIKKTDEYKPGLPFDAWVKVAHHDGSPVTDKTNPVLITTSFDIYRIYRIGIQGPLDQQHTSNEKNTTVTLDDNGMAKLDIVIPENTTNINVKAKYLDTEGYLGYLSKAKSPSDTFIQASLVTENPTINREVSIRVQCTENMKYISYQILGRGDVILTNNVDVPDRKYHVFKFLASFAMVPKAKLIVFYVRSTGEIVSDKIEIEFRSDFQNFVKLDMSTAQASPGQDLDITVTTKPNSFVGLLGVDQSVLLLKSGNDLSKDTIFGELEEYENLYYSPPNRRKRYVPWRPESTWDNFDKSGAIVLTNALEEERRISIIPLPLSINKVSLSAFASSPGVPLIVGGASEFKSSSTPPKIRKEFPETWIWDSLEIQSDKEGFRTAGLPRRIFLESRMGDDESAPLASRARLGPTSSPPPPPTIRKEFPETWIWVSIDNDGASFAYEGITTPPPRPQIFATTTARPFHLSQTTETISTQTAPQVTVRKEFPETWIWNEFDNSGLEGKTVLHKKVPDTITSWVITGFAIDPVTGFGMTQTPKTLNVFQPFFVSTNLPYSVKRGEVVSIPIVVFNYMDKDVTAEVTLDNTLQEFDFTEITNEINPNPKIELYRRKRVDVKAYSGSSVSFMITPKKIGHITIKVTATTPLAGDGVERPLLVEPEGVPQYMNQAIFIDLKDTNQMEAQMKFEIPRNAVPDSTRIEVSVLGDLLGSTIKNLDKLIKMPYGCGEQNMLNFVPNIVILDYLKKIDLLTPEIEGKALKYMESGYQRELTYKHKDGSFSAFGESDKSGSTWLTAFVARSFRQAAKYINVEEDVISKALDWLSDRQSPNGSFPEVGTVSHKSMQGGAGQGIALTAYTLITFLENKNSNPKHSNAISKAMDYIVRNLDGLDDVYALSLAAYALHIADYTSKQYALQLLDAKATTEPQRKWWHKPIPDTDKKNPYYSQPNSVNVEMTAYAMLTYLEAGLVTEALPIMKWLLAQRNNEGGFQSTQDTVIGITALAKIAEKISFGSNSNVDITFKYNEGVETKMTVNKENSMVFQSYQLPNSVRSVNVSATGQGFAVVQLSYKYNLNVTGAWPRFTLDPQVNKNSNQDYLHLSVCTSFIPDNIAYNESNMAVMEVAFPSGYTADLDTLPSLEASEKVKRVETKDADTVVVIYFDSLDRQELCPTLTAYRTFKVAQQKPAPVTVYDYYDNSRRARMFYEPHPATLCDICEGDDCGESCTAKAEQQTGNRPSDLKDPDTWDGKTATTSGASGTVPLFLTILIVAILKNFF